MQNLISDPRTRSYSVVESEIDRANGYAGDTELERTARTAVSAIPEAELRAIVSSYLVQKGESKPELWSAIHDESQRNPQRSKKKNTFSNGIERVREACKVNVRGMTMAQQDIIVEDAANTIFGETTAILESADRPEANVDVRGDALLALVEINTAICSVDSDLHEEVCWDMFDDLKAMIKSIPVSERQTFCVASGFPRKLAKLIKSLREADIGWDDMMEPDRLEGCSESYGVYRELMKMMHVSATATARKAMRTSTVKVTTKLPSQKYLLAGASPGNCR